MTPMHKPAASEAAEQTLSLPDLCSEAADHIARARLSLDDKGYDTDRALAHLDDAIGCLQRLLAKGREPRAAATPDRRSA